MSLIHKKFGLSFFFLSAMSLGLYGGEIPEFLGNLIEKRRQEAMAEVQREFAEEVKTDTEGFHKVMLAINRGVFAKGKTTASEVEKMLAKKLVASDEFGFDRRDVRSISWEVKFDDFSDYRERTEYVVKSARWKSCFEFDENGKLIRVWLE